MKIIEYLQQKYKVSQPSVMTHAEADAFGIPWPLQKGWLAKHGSAEINEYMRSKLGKKMAKRAAKPMRKGKLPSKYHQAGADILLGKSSTVTIIKVEKAEYVPPAKAKNPKIPYVDANSPDFLSSYSWRVVRMQALKLHGAICMCCGDTPKNGAVMNVDHIKPRRTHPELALSLDNLQILCGACNHGKGNWDDTDWRNADPDSQEGLEDYSMSAVQSFLRTL